MLPEQIGIVKQKKAIKKPLKIKGLQRVSQRIFRKKSAKNGDSLVIRA